MGFKKQGDIGRLYNIEDDPRLTDIGSIENLQECRKSFIDPMDLRPLLQDISSSISQLTMAIREQLQDSELSIELLKSIQHYVSYNAPPEGLVYSTGQVAIIVATPNQPGDPDTIGAVGVPGYERHEIYNITNRIAKKVSVINDGADDLYIISSHDGQVFSQEESILLTGESREFYDVYELRIRCATAGNLYRVTEYQYSLAYATFVTPNQTGFDVQTTTVNALPLTTQLPDLTIPNGYSASIRADPDNAGTVYLASSATRLAVAATRIKLAAGDTINIYISNTNLIYCAGSIAGQGVITLVEQ